MPNHMHDIQRFTKGSIWRTSATLWIFGKEIPTNTLFKVAYNRRRDSDTVAVSFIDDAVNMSDISADASPSSKKKHKKKSRRLRYKNADAVVNVARLSGAMLVEDSQSADEYFIRDVDSQYVWAGGGMHRNAAFYNEPVASGNHYISESNARIGIITILFRRNRPSVSLDHPQWKIVKNNVRTMVTEDCAPLEEVWWRNVTKLANAAKGSKHSKGLDSPKNKLQMVANRIKLDDPEWYFAIIDPASLRISETMLSSLGISDHSRVGDVILLKSDEDRVLLKLAVGELVTIIL